METDVARLVRILKPFDRFKRSPTYKLPASFANVQLPDDQRVLGVYENNIDSLAQCVIVTDKSLWSETAGRFRELSYFDMVEADWWPENKREADSLRIRLRDGGSVLVPILGRQGGGADVFEFLRFVISAMGRVRAAMMAGLRGRRAETRDVPAITAIYNQGIAERIATFETRPRAQSEVMAWLADRFPIVVVEDDKGTVIGFAAMFLYRSRECYAGIAEFSVYVERAHRRQGIGRIALEALLEAAEGAGFWKLISRIFVDNTASRELCRALGFREVGVYRRHAELEGEWRDVVIVERLLGEAA